MFKRDAKFRFQWQSKPQSRVMRFSDYGILLSILAMFCALSIAQTPRRSPQTTRAPRPSPQTVTGFSDASGMYSFEREGEFVQITIEQPSQQHDSKKPLAVTGFISRYADTESDRGAFLDYFINKGSLDGDQISFTTKTVHGIYYEFKGTVARGAAATKDKDGYYEMRGTLTQNVVTQDNRVSPRTREITMKLFPDMDRDQSPNK